MKPSEAARTASRYMPDAEAIHSPSLILSCRSTSIFIDEDRNGGNLPGYFHASGSPSSRHVTHASCKVLGHLLIGCALRNSLASSPNRPILLAAHQVPANRASADALSRRASSDQVKSIWASMASRALSGCPRRIASQIA